MAAVIVAMVLITSGCTRAHQYVVVVNDCAEPLKVEAGNGGVVAIPVGGAADFLFDERPSIKIGVGDRAPTSVSLEDWPDTPEASLWGVVTLQGDNCAPTYNDAEMRMVRDDDVSREVKQRIPSPL